MTTLKYRPLMELSEYYQAEYQEKGAFSET